MLFASITEKIKQLPNSYINYCHRKVEKIFDDLK